MHEREQCTRCQPNRGTPTAGWHLLRVLERPGGVSVVLIVLRAQDRAVFRRVLSCRTNLATSRAGFVLKAADRTASTKGVTRTSLRPIAAPADLTWRALLTRLQPADAAESSFGTVTAR